MHPDLLVESLRLLFFSYLILFNIEYNAQAKKKRVQNSEIYHKANTCVTTGFIRKTKHLSCPLPPALPNPSPHQLLLLPCFSRGSQSACDAGDLGSTPGSGRSPGEGNGCPLQYSCLENSMDRGAWRATVHGFSKSQTRLSNEHLHIFTFPSTKGISILTWTVIVSLFLYNFTT